MPNRIVREAILTSERVASLAWPEEVFYRRLMSIVDDYGRSEANPQLLRSKCYPLQTDNVRAADITRWMAACQKAGLILGYDVDGKQYLEVQNFGQQQRSASKCPSPPAIDSRCQQTQSSAHLGVSVSVSVSEDVGVSRASAAPTPSRKSKQTGMPADFAISERVRNWAKEKGYGLLDAHFEAFVSKARAKAYTYADWDEGFMGAVRDDWAELRKGGTKTEVRHYDTAEETARKLKADERNATGVPAAVRDFAQQIKRAA